MTRQRDCTRTGLDHTRQRDRTRTGLDHTRQRDRTRTGLDHTRQRDRTRTDGVAADGSWYVVPRPTHADTSVVEIVDPIVRDRGILCDLNGGATRVCACVSARVFIDMRM